MAGLAKYPNLLSKVKVGDLELANRVALAPLTRARSGLTRIPNDVNVLYYKQRSNAGLVITEATAISEQGIGWTDSAGIMNSAHVEGWKKVTKAVHDEGSRIFLQLWHQGRSSHSTYHYGMLPVSASAVAIQGDGVYCPDGVKRPYEVPRPLETEEVAQVVQDYKAAAQRAKDAGFDGVEIHAANGYLIDQFLQSKTNQRTDKYGGSVEKRYQFLREVLDAVLEVFPAGRVGVRLSPNGVFGDMGSEDFREQFLYAAEQLGKKQIGYVHFMIGLGFGFHKLGEPMTLQEFRAVIPKETAIITNVGYTAETAEADIAAGNADLVAFGRPYLSNPDLVQRFTNDWPLADVPPLEQWFTPDVPLREKMESGWGYTDFPTYEEAQKQ